MEKQQEVEKTEDELIEETASEYELDKEADKEKIDKIVQLKKDRYSATKQKKQAKLTAEQQTKGKEFYKTNLKNLGYDPRTGKPVQKKDEKGKPDKDKNKDQDAAKIAERTVKKIMGRNKMEKMGLDDDTMKEIEDFADWKKISIDEALKRPAIKSMIDRFKDKQDTKKSSITNKHKGSDGKNKTVYNFDKLKNMSDEEVNEYINGLDTESEEYKEFSKWYSKQKDR